MELSAALYEYIDFKPATGSFLTEVLAGLSAERKALSPKYFYDARGSELFEAICELPEYYPTRVELAMLNAAAPELAGRIGSRSAIVEYGSGSASKTPTLIHAVQPVAYVGIDISGEQLRSAVTQLAHQFPRVRMFAVCADYTLAVPLPQLDAADVHRRVVYFPGSTIGNFTVPESQAFLVNARQVAGRGGAMLVGVDLKKDSRILNAAYNDAKGVTAAFNLNLLSRINRELGADFDLDQYEHRAHYDGHAGRIEMHLVSRRDQQVHIDGRTFEFTAGETIHTENSYKYSIEEFQQLAQSAGFNANHYWIDPQALFSIHYLTVPE
ncbi:MAG: L-histidine N(alpha)-methyltransferase [Burkholderiales bacterium]